MCSSLFLVTMDEGHILSSSFCCNIGVDSDSNDEEVMMACITVTEKLKKLKVLGSSML